MAQVMAPLVAPSIDSQDAQHLPPDLTQPASTAAPHGKKRAAEGSLEHEQRLSKRFDLLNLDNNNGPGINSSLYIPVAGSSDVNSAPQTVSSAKPLEPTSPPKKRASRPRPAPADDGMQIEDSPHRVYIHDLAAELSDIESDEENPIFIADIEKHLAKIPKHVLAGPELKATKDNQLILYNVPTSLSMPEEQDKVRKAIKEARARIRERQANPIGEPGGKPLGEDGASGQIPAGTAPGDGDAMDLD